MGSKNIFTTLVNISVALSQVSKYASKIRGGCP